MSGLNPNLTLSYRYAMKNNIISISIPLEGKGKKFTKDPVVWGVIMGIVLGLLCRQLPQPVNSFLVDEIASPLQSVILNMISGVMGPVIVISLLTSIIALDIIMN